MDNIIFFVNFSLIGTKKSLVVNALRHTMRSLEKLYPNLYSKTIKENDYDTGKVVKMVAESETELSLYQRLAMIGKVFILCDELDAILNRIGVFNAGDEGASSGSKLLCQAYDLISNDTRGTGCSSITIDEGLIIIFGASTGEKYTKNISKFGNNFGNDGVLARFIFHVVPMLDGVADINSKLLKNVPNLLHILIIVSLIGEQNCTMRFHELPNDFDRKMKGTPLQYQTAYFFSFRHDESITKCETEERIRFKKL